MALSFSPGRPTHQDTTADQQSTKPVMYSHSTPRVGPMVILERKQQKGISTERVTHALKLPFNPNLTKTLMHLEKFSDLPLPDIKKYIRGLIINVDNTLAEPGAQEFPDEVLATLREVRKIMPVCFFSENDDHRPQLEKIGISFARNIPSKPDPVGFKMAACLKLDLRAENCAMVGSDYTRDGACREAGMRYIHVDPISGPNESFSEKAIRGYGNLVARIHDRFRQK